MCNHLFDWQLYYRIIVFLDRPYFVHVILCIEVLPLALWRYICLPLEYIFHTLEVRQFVTNTWKTHDAKQNRRLSKDRVIWLVLIFISCIHKKYTNVHVKSGCHLKMSFVFEISMQCYKMIVFIKIFLSVWNCMDMQKDLNIYKYPWYACHKLWGFFLCFFFVCYVMFCLFFFVFLYRSASAFLWK